MPNYLRVNTTEFLPLRAALSEVWLCWTHDEGLTLPVSKADAVDAFIFLLFDSSSESLFPAGEVIEEAKMEDDLIAALLSFIFFSNLEANFTLAAVAPSSVDGGRSLIPRPNFLDATSSSATFLFWPCMKDIVKTMTVELNRVMDC